MLRPGDRVFINGTAEEDYVREVHTNDVIVRVMRPGGYDERSYAHESLRFVPVVRMASKLYAR